MKICPSGVTASKLMNNCCFGSVRAAILKEMTLTCISA